MPMACIGVVAVVGHMFLSWLLMLKLGWGLAGAAVVLDGSWWFITIAQITYVLWGSCGEAWSGFSWKAFSNLKRFLHIFLPRLYCFGKILSSYLSAQLPITLK